MDNRSILITGCSTGIGYCLAINLKQRGFRVFASVRNSKDIAGLLEAGLESLQLDLNSSDSIKSALTEVLDKTGGKLFALINNGA